MVDAGSFYTNATPRLDQSNLPSPLSNESLASETSSVGSEPKKQSSRAKHFSPPSTSSSSVEDSSSHSPFTSRFRFLDLENAGPYLMLSTPLPDYRHSANQSTRGRAQANANRKNSTTSGGSNSDRKNAIQAAEFRAAAAADAPGRSSSISSHTVSSGLTMVTSSDPPPTDALLAQPFATRNGRRYLRDTTLPYPLPCDLSEIHRQTLRTMLLCQVFNGPICSPAFEEQPPKSILEVGCGTGFWSVMCHKHFSRMGHSSISFTGIDIAPLSPQPDPEDDMNWRFVQHDLRRIPLPFRDEEFHLIMVKDLSLVTPTTGMQQALMDEYLRILKPGGSLEIWDGDHSLRMLLPHTPPLVQEDSDDSEDEEQVYTNAMGTYTLTPQTPLAPPQNQYLLEFNAWIAKALEARSLTPMPCTTMRPMLLQESETLVEIDSRRLAIPLGEVRWEREGVGGATNPGTNGAKGKGKDSDRRVLTTGQAALRRTALLTVVQMIESLEPLLREASGKGQDEWDRWQGGMMNDLLQSNGTSWGECLEIGAWWARKK